MAVTLKDIATRVGVSRQVISAVLNGSAAGRVSPEKRQHIMAVVRELGYTPNYLAKALAEKKTWTIGFINGDIESPFHSSLTGAMFVAAEKRGYKLLLLVTQWNREKELSCLEQMRNYQVDGIIMNGSVLHSDDAVVIQMSKERFPFVSIGGDLSDFTCINPDFLPGMNEAFELLYNTGHRRIALADINGSIKYTAYIACCHKYDVEPILFEYPPIFKAGYGPVAECGARIAASLERPDAVIVGNDEGAAMIIKGLASGGLKVPDDISLIANDGTYLHAMLQPVLTDIVLDRNLIADTAVEHLIAQIEQKDQYRPIKIAIPTRLAVFDSVMKRNFNL